MIQRIQSIYLLSACILMGILLFTPFAVIVDDNGTLYQFYAKGLTLMGDGKIVVTFTPMMVFIMIISLLFFISIFLYKNRVLQMRLCVFSMLLIVGMHGLFFYYSFYIGKHLQIGEINYSTPVIFPILCLILAYLAFRAIRKDEMLIKSYDRIR